MAKPYNPRYAIRSVSQGANDFTEPILYYDGEAIHNGHTKDRLGHPGQKSAISWKDVVSVAAVWISFGVSVASVYPQNVAVFVGQTNQLIVVGIALTIMAFCTKRQVTSLVILQEVASGRSTLQNFDALLRDDILTANASMFVRALLVLLFLLPLGLSAGYKRFVGGVSTINVISPGATFGLVGPPGFQAIGLGTSLITNLYVPFWNNASFPRTYGNNLFVASNTTAAILDGPFPADISSIQSTLQDDEIVHLTTTVNATVTEDIPISAVDRANLTWWESTLDLFPGPDIESDDLLYYHHAAIVLGTGDSGDNQTLAFVSIWTTSINNQTFTSEARQVVTTRRLCSGTWSISRTNVTLTSATVLQDAAEAQASVDQNIIDNNQMQLVPLFGKLVDEYDWTRFQDSNSTQAMLRSQVNTVPALVCAIIWARVVSQCGLLDGDNNDGQWDAINHYYKDDTMINTTRQRATLQRQPLLLVILLIHPVVTTVAACLKMLYRHMPVSDGFGIVSLLAAASPESLGILEGAGLTGHLTRRLYVRFSHDATAMEDRNEMVEKVQVVVGEKGKPDRVITGKIYG
ncbi:hypothetical protein F5884DRAFT_781573 [Xylogone sp. PMI_703]|nr:hypothetical protein F5884DRAFT_781573 [Xylogone sp. PMI_703]